MKRMIAGFLSLFMLFTITGCDNSSDKNTTTDSKTSTTDNYYADDASVHIYGEGVDFTLTNDEFKDLELKEVKTTNVDSAGNTSDVTLNGFSLKEILNAQENSVDLSKISSVDLKASDGYIMNVANAEYADSDIYLMADEDGQKLDYPRSAIPGKRAMYWVRDLTEIELKGATSGDLSDSTSTTVDTINFFREGILSLEPKTQNNRGIDVNAYSLKDYFDNILKSNTQKDVSMTAKDGFKKNETMDVLLTNYVTFEGIEGEEDQIPLYFSTDLNFGMRVKQLDTIITENTAIYFGEEVNIADLMKEVGMAEADIYKFVCSDGFEMDIPADAMSSGKIYLDEEEGYVRSDFGEYDLSSVSGKGKAKHLISITASKSDTSEADASKTSETLLKCFVGDEKKMLTEEDFMALPQDTQTISKTNSKGVSTTAEYTGVHFADICKAIGADPQTAKVTLVASDGYESSPTNEMLNDPQSLFSLYENGEYIESDGDGRVWFTCSENYTANNWAKYITKIVIE